MRNAKIHIELPTQNNKLKLPVIVVECKMHILIVFSSTQHINLQLRVIIITGKGSLMLWVDNTTYYEVIIIIIRRRRRRRSSKWKNKNKKKKYWKNSTGITIIRNCVGARLVQKKSRELKKITEEIKYAIAYQFAQIRAPFLKNWRSTWASRPSKTIKHPNVQRIL